VNKQAGNRKKEKIKEEKCEEQQKREKRILICFSDTTEKVSFFGLLSNLLF
jgi:hypothetical protein